ncbi:MAG: nucleotide exchange factor GrpE [Candidatus Buchananbacteria bacterium RBG_13_36_9]|uniref:Protein GrpE n=1 Tax=Candidatus Buchananbacteria bacterium RBG_13_36_9 TaxID=1797530 RepID=A0A1G1XPV3_9BACT|nr:MAG: nucleotide exchange factor GrpE [Candidatus Buchananbacteria bacterium RBG_13_36_9]
MPEETQQPNNQQTELEQLKAQAAEYLAGWQRAKADYINFKKETEEKQKMIFEFANATLLMEVLPIYDNFKKAIALAGEEKNSWLDGIKQIKKQIEDLLKDHGVEEMKTIGKKFNPEFHEAVSREKKEGVAPDMIISEASTGYLMKGKVLVPAKVVVAE